MKHAPLAAAPVQQEAKVIPIHMPRRERGIQRGRPVQLSRWQTDVFMAGHRWRHTGEGPRYRVVIAGRRSGKTFEIVPDMVATAVELENSNVGYWAPTWTMAKDLLWEPLKAYIPKGYLKGKPSESELVIDLVNDSRLYLRSGDNPDRSRGPGWDAAYFDEASFFKDERIWEEIVYPATTDRHGSASFYTTPQGLDWMYDLFLQGKNRADYPDWQSWQVKTLEGGRVSAQEIEKARRGMDPRRFRQEFEASFEALGNRVYDMFDPTLNTGNIRDDVVDNGGDLLVGIDFNVNPMSLVLGTKAGDELHVFDSLAIHTSSTQEAAQELRRRYPDRSIIACPDPSGKARKTSAIGGQTDFSILEAHGIKVDAPSKAPAVADRINVTNAMCYAADGRRRLLVHPRAESLIRAFMGQVYKKNTSIPEKKGFDHPVDACGYLIWQRFNLLEARWHESTVVW